MSRIAIKIGLSTLVSVSALAVSTTAMAQGAEGVGNDIIVTAKNRAEKLQDVPLAITTLTADDLIGSQVSEVRDLQKIAPNLSFSGGGRGDPTAYSLRGIAPNTSDERYQGISFFLDGVALSGQLASVDISNLERVEVIKGPQSATFGRATYSGAINFITSNPKGDRLSGFVRGRGSLTHGAPEGSYYFGASLEGPLVQDKLWFNIAGTTFRNGAIAKTVDDKLPVGREDTQIAVGTLFFQPDPTFSIKLRALYSHDRDSARAVTIQHPREWLQAGAEVRPFARGNGAFFPTYMPDPNYRNIGSVHTSGREQDRYFASLIVSKTFGDYELNYRGGYFYDTRFTENPAVPRAYEAGVDPVYGELLATGVVTRGSTHRLNATSTAEKFFNTSHQLLLLSPGNQPFRWRIGGYYFWEKDKSLFPSLALPQEPTGLSSQDTFENIAGFGGIDWDLTKALTLSAEGRIARETVRSPGVLTSPIRPSDVNGKYGTTDFTPRVTLSYKLTPDNMVYALYSKGIKSARFSRISVDNRDVITVALPEQLKNYEIGSKNSFWNGRLVLNAAAFLQKVTNQQLTSIQRITVQGREIDASFVSNVGASEVWGFELEMVAKPVRNLTLQGALGYARQEFTTKAPIRLSSATTWGFPPAADNSVVIDGLQQGNVPDWTAHLAGEYVWPEAVGGMSAKFRLDGSYRGSYNVMLSNQVKVRSSWTVDARISLFNDGIDFALFGRNILNNQRVPSSSLAGASAGCAYIETDVATYGPANTQQCLLASVRRPAEWGAEATFRF